MNQTQWKYLEAHPQSSYKQLFLKGTRIRAEIIAGEMDDGEPADGEPSDPMTPEKIAADWNLSVEAVREAIAYCESDPPEIEEDHRRVREDLQAMGVIDAEGNYLRGTLPYPLPESPSNK